MNNEKQIALGYLLYSDDNGGFLPIAGSSAGGTVVLPTEWAVEISPYLSKTSTNNLTINAQGTVLTCPSANLALLAKIANTSGDTNMAGFGGYGHNYYYLGYTVDYWNAAWHRKKLSEITKPTDTIFNSDTLDPMAGDVYQVEYYGYSYPTKQVLSRFPNHTYTRHGNGDNYAWADGHIAFMTWKQASDGLNGQQDWFWMISK